MVENRLRLIVVEDNPVDALVIQDELGHVQSEARFELTVVKSLAEMRQAVDNETFDMVLLDLGLEDSQGLETLRAARAFLPNVPIVVMSGLEDEGLALQAVRESAQDYIVKDRWNRRLLVRSLLHAFERERLAKAKEQAERAQTEIEGRFRAVFDGTHDIICIKDRSRRITHVNPAMASLFGRNASEFIGTREEDWYGPSAAVHIRKWDIRVLDGETLEEEHTRAVEGEPMAFLDQRIPLFDSRQEIVGLCCISRNVTERKKAVPQEQIVPTEYPSKAMRSLMQLAGKVAESDGTILLQGETGSGKDYLARWIHEHSQRSGGPYFALNCAALNKELAESELFGHEAGAFTGARGRKRGMLELSEGGSLLLNEIGELPLALQSKLLTFLDTKSFLRVGGQRSVTVDARVMAASHRNLMAEVAEGRFLEPLYFRLAVFPLRVPPLRERKEDLAILVEEIVAELAKSMNRRHMPVIDGSTVEKIRAYHWPGNVRELRNSLERALILWNGDDFDLNIPFLESLDQDWSQVLTAPSQEKLHEATDELIKSMCAEALALSRGNKKQAAKKLGISRDALYRYIRRFKIG